jgi:pimeloyl-ACP methyl ester carboxylesterase
VVSTPHLVPFARARAADEDQQKRSGYMDVFRAEGGVAEQLFLDNDAAGLRRLYTDAGMEPAVVEEYVTLFQQPGVLTAALNWYRAGSLSEPVDLGRIAPRTLYVWSDNDMALGRVAAEATGEYVDGPYRFEVLPGISHWIPEAAPARLNELLLEHLGSTA